jgi:hypothetical protein
MFEHETPFGIFQHLFEFEIYHVELIDWAE